MDAPLNDQVAADDQDRERSEGAQVEQAHPEKHLIKIGKFKHYIYGTIY